MSKTHPKISMIVAMAQNRVIGKDNQLPWHFSEDLKHFKKLTLGKTIIMGRNTYESIGKALPGRKNIVLSTRDDYQLDDAIVVANIEQAMAQENEQEEVMIIGGGSLYNKLLSQADKIYLTIIEHDYDGDTFFPELDFKQWQQTAEQSYPADEKHPHPFKFITLERC